MGLVCIRAVRNIPRVSPERMKWPGDTSGVSVTGVPPEHLKRPRGASGVSETAREHLKRFQNAWDDFG